MDSKINFLFGIASLCEIGGGYVVWQWFREGKGWKLTVTSTFVLVHGIIPTFQPSNF